LAEIPTQPLDHAATRIVTELAAALLPHLKETVSAELTKTIEALPLNIDREVEETLSSLRRLQVLFEDMAAALNSAKSSALRVSNELLPLSRACETLNVVIERIEQFAAKPELDVSEMHVLLRSMEAAISDWEGVLKANGRAQTKELSEFSAEVSELMGGMNALPAIMRETLEKALPTGAEKYRSAGESLRLLEAKLARLEKIVLAEGFVLIVFFAAIAAALFLK